MKINEPKLTINCGLQELSISANFDRLSQAPAVAHTVALKTRNV